MKRNDVFLLISLAMAGLLLSKAQAACLSDEQVHALAGHYAAKTPADNPQGLTREDGACSRARFNALLAQKLGRVIGYKAGLTHPEVQKRFHTDQPVWGTLYEGMLLPSGAVVEAKFGARPLFEADLLLRVKDAAAMRLAKTPDEVLAASDRLFPFIELPDLVVQDPAQLNGAAISAINVGARLGVVGPALATPGSAAQRSAWVEALRDMTVVVTDGSGTTLAQGKGSNLLGHPLNAVIWLVSALAEEGLALQPGDLISLGSFTALLPPRAGLTATVTYDGLPGALPVSVSFK